MLCDAFGVNRRTYYHALKAKKSKNDGISELEKQVIKIFNESRRIYGCRKIMMSLRRYHNVFVSKNTVAKVMRKYNLVSVYNLQLKRHHRNSGPNESQVGNILNRQFGKWGLREALVSDLTYIRVDNRWQFLCTIIDLCNREIVGFSIGAKKDSQLVKDAFLSIKNCDLRRVKIFHTDRGKEFDNYLISTIVNSFKIDHSLSKKGCPYDNAVAETTFKTIKKELINVKSFKNLQHFKAEVADYIHWYNTKRIHGAINYLTPNELKLRLIYTNLPA